MSDYDLTDDEPDLGDEDDDELLLAGGDDDELDLEDDF
jgi:hypothetical protein